MPGSSTAHLGAADGEDDTLPSTSSPRAGSPSSSYSNPRSKPSSNGKIRTKSYESLKAHPLLGDADEDHRNGGGGGRPEGTSHQPLAPGTASSTSSTTTRATSQSANTTAASTPPLLHHTSPNNSNGSSPCQVNYKPRQRPPSLSHINPAKTLPLATPPSHVAAATTSTPSVTTASTTAPPPLLTSSGGQGGSSTSVTAKLQLQSIQAAVQAAGLVHDSAGWLMLQRLVSESDRDKESDPGWDVILAALKSGKAALLVPKESATLSDITPKYFRDHVIIKDGRNVVSLSGVRGVKDGDTLHFTSCVPGLDLKQPIPGDGVFADLLSATLPATPTDADAPQYHLGKVIDLHLPKNALASSSASKHTKAPAKSRSLASLFGGNRPSISPNSSPRNSVVGLDSAPTLASTPVAPSAGPTNNPPNVPLLPLSAWPIDRSLNGRKLIKAVGQYMHTRVRTGLATEDTKVIEMTIHFVDRFHPSRKMSTVTSPVTDEDEYKDVSYGSLTHAKVDECTTAMQEFLYDVRNRLEDAQQERLALAEALQEPGDEKSKEITYLDVDASLEKVEALVCELLYDKLFSPLSSLDRQNDESLSTRIAGLHMLDLTLDHLGLEIESESGEPDLEDNRRVLREGLEDIVQQCSKEFRRLQDVDCRTPAAKLDVLIQVHKLIANSLEQLPPIPMKTDLPPTTTSAEDVVTPGSTRRNSSQVFEMSDDAKSLGGRSARRQNRPGTPTPDPSPQAEDRTPRMPASRPGSVTDSSIPAIRLPEATLQDTYAISTAGGFTGDGSDPATTSYFDVKSDPSIPATSKPKTSSTTSADAILPLLIYAVVQANPVKLVSHVLFVQRFRADSLMRGEGEYCLCNMEAVKAFLLGCDVASLGLGTDKLISTRDLPTIPTRMRQRTAQQLDNMVGSAGKVLGHAADLGLGGFRMVGGLLARSTPTAMASTTQPTTIEEVQTVLAGSTTKAASFRNSILRRSTIGSIVPSIKSDASGDRKETELSDVGPSAASDAHDVPPGEDAKKITSDAPVAPGLVSSAASISSRLASLPGLSRFGVAPTLGSDADRTPPSTSARPQMSSSPSKSTSFFAALSSPLLPVSNNADPNPALSQTQDGLAEPTTNNDARRRSTISIFPAPFNATSSGGSDAGSPMVSPTGANSPSIARADGLAANTNSDGASSPKQKHQRRPKHADPHPRTRTQSFMSHSQHHEHLRTASGRARSDSGSSKASSIQHYLTPATAESGLFRHHGSSALQPHEDSIRSEKASSGAEAAREDVADEGGEEEDAAGLRLGELKSMQVPPLQRFMDCEAEDLKLSEVAELLADYKRLALELKRRSAY